MKKENVSESGILKQIIRLCRAGTSSTRYYEAMNSALYQLNDHYTMLHYPLHRMPGESFHDAQANLTLHCLSHIEPVNNMTVLEIGCGNGVQTMFIAKVYNPKYITGVDLNRKNVLIANKEKKACNASNCFFLVDDAQKMKKIKDASFQIVINIESAFHYPDKQAFLNEVSRVLEPGGRFIIADITRTRRKRQKGTNSWRRNMSLNHWTAGQYAEGLVRAGLSVVMVENMTSQIIKGYKNYRSYFRYMKKRSVLHTAIYRFFFIINVMLNIWLLKSIRQYIIFSGLKPIPV